MFPRRLITEGPDRYFALKRASSNLLSGRTVNYTYDDLYRILSFVGRQEKIESRVGVHATFRHPDLVRTFLAFGLLTFRQFVEHVGGLMHPAALRARGAEHLRQRFPEGLLTFVNVRPNASPA